MVDQHQQGFGRVLHKSAISLAKEAPDYKPTASIPAKFETVLSKGPR